MFMYDVTTCFAALKKVVHDLRSTSVDDDRLQMAQSSVRPAAISLNLNPRAAIAMDFDALVADWDAYLEIGGQRITDPDGGDYDPKGPHLGGKRPKAKVNAPPTENARTELHTLTEHHDHILSASFDLSFHESGRDEGFDPSSSQALDFIFEENPFALSDGLDVGGLADDLAQELGWVEHGDKWVHYRSSLRPTIQSI
ncbi:hypothetical protein H0H93_002960 [Arthromyces matolae]|nr:hypothetical protein H0H93_002960 [Arthromyces matolae]